MTTTVHESARTGLPAWQEVFVERVGLAATPGLPPSVSRVLGWLVVCDPPTQSSQQIRETLELSAGSVSAATTLLARFGMVARVSLPGKRRVYYQLRPEGWQRALRIRMQTLTQTRLLAEQALSAAGGSHERLRNMRDFYGWCEAQFAALLEDEAAGTPTSPP